MAMKIRLARAGTKKRPYYHIVVADATSPRDGKFIDVVGAFNPMLKKDDEKRIQLDAEKAAAWLKKGAQPTDRVLALAAIAVLVGGTPFYRSALLALRQRTLHLGTGAGRNCHRHEAEARHQRRHQNRS